MVDKIGMLEFEQKAFPKCVINAYDYEGFIIKSFEFNDYDKAMDAFAEMNIEIYNHLKQKEKDGTKRLST